MQSNELTPETLIAYISMMLIFFIGRLIYKRAKMFKEEVKQGQKKKVFLSTATIIVFLGIIGATIYFDIWAHFALMGA